MKLTIHNKVLERFPRTKIGFLIAKIDQEAVATDLIDQKVSHIQEGMLEKGFVIGQSVKGDPRIKVWRDTYAQFGVKSNDFPSSIEALGRRALNNKFPRISPIIDFYNAYSLEVLLPMGGYDLDKIVGDISLCFAEEGDRFRGLGHSSDQQLDPKHIVYKDSQQVICWLWNHKDAADTAIVPSTKRAIFFIDCVDASLQGIPSMETAVETFGRELGELGACTHLVGCLSGDAPHVEVHASV